LLYKTLHHYSSQKLKRAILTGLSRLSLNSPRNFVELKKLVYLYLMNYAKSQPDMAIMAVNTFVKDCEVSNLPVLYPAVLADPVHFGRMRI
jgi:Adaptin N terminal region